MDRRLTPANGRVVARAHGGAFPDLTPVDPAPHFVAAPVLDLSLAPGGNRDRQLRYGEPFALLDHDGDFAFGHAPDTDYVGWVAASALRHAGTRGTARARVCARHTHAYAEPDFKSPETQALPHGARLEPGAVQDRFTLTELGWVPSVHLTLQPDTDPAAVADLYLGTPYLWGANSSFGIDCSGLIQAALLACAIRCPGDSDLQEAAFADVTGPLQRGDLLFWKGHVAMAVDTETLIHANAHHMAVVHEPVAAAIARIEAQGDGPVTSHKRPTKEPT